MYFSKPVDFTGWSQSDFSKAWNGLDDWIRVVSIGFLKDVEWIGWLNTKNLKGRPNWISTRHGMGLWLNWKNKIRSGRLLLDIINLWLLTITISKDMLVECMGFFIEYEKENEKRETCIVGHNKFVIIDHYNFERYIGGIHESIGHNKCFIIDHYNLKDMLVASMELFGLINLSLLIITIF